MQITHHQAIKMQLHCPMQHIRISRCGSGWWWRWRCTCPGNEPILFLNFKTSELKTSEVFMKLHGEIVDKRHQQLPQQRRRQQQNQNTKIEGRKKASDDLMMCQRCEQKELQDEIVCSQIMNVLRAYIIFADVCILWYFHRVACTA